jgi:hypothetical protein
MARKLKSNIGWTYADEKGNLLLAWCRPDYKLSKYDKDEAKIFGFTGPHRVEIRVAKRKRKVKK